MSKLDSQNRLLIPRHLLELSNTNFDEEIRLYFIGKQIFLDNPSNRNRRTCCLGSIKLDEKYRFILPKNAREFLNINQQSTLIFYVRCNKISFRKS